MNSILDQAGASSDAARPEARPIGRIFPLDEDSQRGPQLRDAWAGFGREMAGAVRSALESGRSPPEIAYAVGEIVHNYFRTRGLTLTSYELRRLVGELVGPSRRAEAAPRPAAGEARNLKTSAELVTFVGQQAALSSRALVDEENAASPPVVAEAAFEPPPSRLVNLIGREGAAFDRLLARVVVAAASPSQPSTSGGSVDRERAFGIVDRTIDELAAGEQLILPAEIRERLARLALTEICGLGPIDRLLADYSVRAVFVDGPQRVYVERANGARELVSDGFRDRAHLSAIAGRLARAATRGLETLGSVPGGIVEFQLRDGGSGTVIFPPAAPGGPVLVVRRGEPGMATLQRLITSAMIDRRIAGLLRIAARTRLNTLVTGAEGAGKTALLAAIMRDQSATRIVTLARHREFRWPSLATVELVAASDGGGPSYTTLLGAAERIGPDLLVLDSVQAGEALALVERLSRGARGTIAAVQSAALASALARSFDLVVRLGRSRDGHNRALSVEDGTGAEIFVFEDGHFRCRTAEPSFAAAVRSAGFGESLYLVLR